MVDVWEGEEWYHRPPRRQADSVTLIAAPVSGTKYVWRAGETGAGAELGDQSNVRIISINAVLTWATTQPTPLEVHITIDGQAIIHAKVNPVSADFHNAYVSRSTSQVTQSLETDLVASAAVFFPSPLYEGRSFKVEVEITWAVTQPTNLIMRVKWARWP